MFSLNLSKSSELDKDGITNGCNTTDFATHSPVELLVLPEDASSLFQVEQVVAVATENVIANAIVVGVGGVAVDGARDGSDYIT